MDALLTAFVAAALAEWGDKTQLLVALLAAATRRPGRVLAGLFLALAASNALAAAAGTVIAGMVTIRAMTLLVALALLFAGVAGLIRREVKEAAPARWLVAGAFVLCLAAEIGDRTQFLTFALAGRFGSAPLTAAGATAGALAACLPAALLGERLRETVPMRPLRYAIAGAFLVAGFLVAVSALQLA